MVRNEHQIFKSLEFMSRMVQTPFYWTDTEGRFLGVNEKTLEAIGARKKEDIIGKNVYELYKNKEIGDAILEDIYEVIRTNRLSVREDRIIDITTGKFRYFSATRAPLCDSDGKIIAIVGISIEITREKEAQQILENQQIFNHLEHMTEAVPAAVYWLNLDYIVTGVNKELLTAIGAKNKYEIVGKTVYDFYPPDIANNLQKDFKNAICTGKVLEREHLIKDISTGKNRYFAAKVSPLRDNSKKIIGIIGVSIETTSEKDAELLKHENRKLEAQNKINQIVLEKQVAEAERLRLENEVQKLENEKQKAVLEEQDRFRKFVGQIVHDIRSPLASLRGLVDASSTIIPEEERITLRQASMRISDIAQRMLTEYKNEVAENEITEPVLVPAAILEVLSEKRYEYNTINFNYDFFPNADFAFIQIEPSQFKRMISNLLNNSVEAIESKPDGKINLTLNIDSQWVKITITDNGKGMSEELVNKIESNIAVSEGKKHGFGIGFAQIRDTVKRNFGEFKIFSTLEVRTSILIKFPKIPAPYWIAQEIKIVKDDTIIVLDDDSSIHGAWDLKLAPVLAKMPEIRIKHFSNGVEVVNFINTMSAIEKSQICLLTDYELLNQNINGIQVIEQTKIKRSTLVTSHYANSEIRKQAANLRIKILPKERAFAIPINLDKKVVPGSKKVDIVWVDDAVWFIRNWKLKFTDLIIDEYYDPDSFLEDAYQYSLDTKIILDGIYYDGQGSNRNYLGDGYDLARTLHEKGYTNLFMITGDEPEAGTFPDYLTVIFKEDDEKIKEIIKS